MNDHDPTEDVVGTEALAAQVEGLSAHERSVSFGGEVLTVADVAEPEQHETLRYGNYELQNPYEFVADLSDKIHEAKDGVYIEVMQFEKCAATEPIFEALIEKNRSGVPVDFVYDRVALNHIRSGEGEAFIRGDRIVTRGGDKHELQQAARNHERFVTELEIEGISDPGLRERGNRKRLNHDHVKLAIVDNEAWIGTMNLRELDFNMSNFMVKMADPYWVDVLKEVFDDAKNTKPDSDKVYTKPGAEHPDTALLLDHGVKKQSVIYDQVVRMAESLQPGDEFELIGQFPPINVMYGKLMEVLSAKMKGDAKGTFLISPEGRSASKPSRVTGPAEKSR